MVGFYDSEVTYPDTIPAGCLLECGQKDARLAYVEAGGGHLRSGRCLAGFSKLLGLQT